MDKNNKILLACLWIIYLGALAIAIFFNVWISLGITALTSFAMMMYASEKMKSKKRGYESIQGMVQRENYLEFIPVRRKASSKSAIGGFVIPILPLWVTVNESTNKGGVEPLVHEHMHIFALIYLFQAPLMYFMFGILELIQKISWMTNWPYIIIAITLIVAYSLFQEYIAFTATHKFCRKLNVDTEEFSAKVVKKYLIYYTTFFLTVFIFSFLAYFVNVKVLYGAIVGAVLYFKWGGILLKKIYIATKLSEATK